jgi:hypothetical protein
MVEYAGRLAGFAVPDKPKPRLDEAYRQSTKRTWFFHTEEDGQGGIMDLWELH